MSRQPRKGAGLASAGGANHDGTPNLPQTFLASGITRTYNGGSTQFDLSVDAGNAVGDGTSTSTVLARSRVVKCSLPSSRSERSSAML